MLVTSSGNMIHEGLHRQIVVTIHEEWRWRSIGLKCGPKYGKSNLGIAVLEGTAAISDVDRGLVGGCDQIPFQKP